MSWYPNAMLYRGTILSGVVLATLFVPGGCESGRTQRTAPTPTESVLRVTQQVGGTHYRMVLHEDVWYQTFGSDLLVLEPRSARVLHTLSLGRIGEVGGAIDMLLHDESLYIVLDADAVLEVSIAEPRRPRIVYKQSAVDLGIQPKRLSIADGELYVSGIGGVVRWFDNRRVYSHLGDVSRVVSSDERLVASVGRRIYRLEDGSFVGSASELIHARKLNVQLSEVARERLLVFVRQSPEGALVGLMGPDLRELDSRNLTVAVPGYVQSIRIFDEHIWIVTDTEIMAYAVDHERLERTLLVDILGARDLARADENHLAVAGSFGRSLYRMRTTDRGAGDTFVHAHREPSRLTYAKSDGRHILAGSEESSWLYLIGSRVELSSEPLDRDDAPPPPTTTATTVDSRARIHDEGAVLAITGEFGVIEHVEPHGARIHCVTSVEGEYWIGHDRGITILRSRPPLTEPRTGMANGNMVTRTLRLDGPVRYLFPLRIGRGVAFVSEFGGFGIAQWVEEPIDAPVR